MRYLTLLGLCALSLVFAQLHGPSGPRRHHDIAKRAKGDIQLHRRFTSARWTFYDVGLGACGQWNKASDFIVALNSASFGGGFPGPHCFETISMTYNGKTTNAVIMDECPGCPPGGLDLSRGLFSFFASEDAGVIYGDWSYGNGSPAPTSAPAPLPSHTTSTPPPPPSTHSTHSIPIPTPTPTPTPSSTSTSTSATSHIISKSTTTSSSATSASSSSALPTPTGIQNLDSINQIILGLAGIVVAGDNIP